MSTGFEKADRDSFFEIDQGVGQLARVFKPDANGDIEMDNGTPPAPVFLREINSLFFSDTQEINLYSDTSVEASDPSMVIASTDAAGIKRGFRVVFPNLEATDDGYGQTFEITPRNPGETVQAVRMKLKQL